MRRILFGLVVFGSLVGLMTPSFAGGACGYDRYGRYYCYRGAPYYGAPSYGPHYSPYGYYDRDYYRERRRDRNAAIALGIIGAISAAIISQQRYKHRRHYRHY